MALERTSNSSVECPRETSYSSEACPRGHIALRYSIRGDSFKGGHVTLRQRDQTYARSGVVAERQTASRDYLKYALDNVKWARFIP